ncbi:barnase inhibitor [Amycolatopsis antarctica]|uniref:Barnase inhibitor n=1 Tax=Amycolatopsis antarctica TaxID=1854586 RepID=A0A263D3M9_9PSEU|nr:barstar family protein [Amycolatopsis antarctica]OZM72819.1 barnase inhibitor [Amycolatopsis antarctica]
MSAFESDSDRTHPFDFLIIQDKFISLFSDADFLAATVARLDALGYQLVVLDAALWMDSGAVCRDFAVALGFPRQDERSLDALEDYFYDVAAREYGDPNATGLAVVLEHYDQFAHADPSIAQALLSLFARTARRGSLLGHRMMCLVHTDDTELSFPSIYEVPIQWASGFWPYSEESQLSE